MSPLPRPTQKNRPDANYSIAKTEMCSCNKVWDENARKRFFFITNMNEYEYCHHKIIFFIKRNTIQCSNRNVSLFVQLF